MFCLYITRISEYFLYPHSLYIHQPKQVLSDLMSVQLSVKLSNAFSSFSHQKMGGLDSVILDFDDWMITIGIRYIVSVCSPFHNGSCFMTSLNKES